MADVAMTIIQAGAMVSIFAFVFSRGLSTPFGDLKYFVTRPGLLIRSLLSVDVLVPLIAVTVVILIRPSRAAAIGLLILASAPAAPMVLKKIAKAGGKPEYAVSLQLVLASLAILTTPITLYFLSSVAGFQLQVSPWEVAGRIGVSILLPIIAGMIIRWLSPALAGRIYRPLEALSDIGLILVVIVVLLSTYHMLFTPDIRSYAAIASMIVGALVAGHLMAAGRPEEQTTLALESATRNIGLALLIASAFASLEQALPILIPYLVTSTVLGLIYVRYQKRKPDVVSHPGP
jgi:BASS family bile acid:Na+ symporter